MRSYGDPCGVARALDLVGDRWALLVVRELLLGPKRFTDVLAGLPGASPNVLAHRLRALEDAGVLRRRKLEPPAAAWVYDLTERGRELEPVLLALGRWGSPLPSPPDTEFGVDAMMFALKSLFDSRAVGRLRARYQVTLGSERFKVEIAKGRLDIIRGAAAEVDAVIDTDIPTLRAVVFGRLQLGKAQKQGRLRIEGDREAATKLFESFIPVETSPH